MSQYFPKACEPFGGDIGIKVDWSNYSAKAEITNISHIGTSGFVLKSNFASLKTEADKLDFGKSVPVPVALTKLSDEVKNDVKKLYDKW